MSYTRPSPSVAAATWVGLPTYSRPSPGTAGASWVPAGGTPDATVVAPSPLGAPAVLVGADLLARVSAPSPLSAIAAAVWQDWTVGYSPEAAAYFAMDITGTPTLRVPVSSWQATIQTGRATYVQAVVPAATNWAAALAAREGIGEIVIYKGVLAPDGSPLEMELARGPLSTVTSDRGPRRHTCTVSGYGAPFVPDTGPLAVSSRPLLMPRSLSQTGSNHRVRCAIDWILRPGMTAILDDLSFEVAYINYYVGGSDAYMDVGSRVA